MSKSEIDKTLPILASTIDEILKQHADVKGIIHCVSFKVAKYLFENLKNDRFLIHDSSNRDATLTNHVYNDSPTVLLSPSMMEGVDLADEASRFQIMCKIPFPYLGDKLILRRKELDNEWYAYQTAKTIIQAMGRSVRNENDHAVSYILDADWAYFYQRNSHLFPDDFRQSLRL
jgi:Rad3-related DNA helicase